MATERQIYHVQRANDGKRWEVQKEGSNRASAIEVTQRAAIERGKELAKSAPIGQVKIKGRDGRIRSEHTYVADPSRYEG